MTISDRIQIRVYIRIRLTDKNICPKMAAEFRGPGKGRMA